MFFKYLHRILALFLFLAILCGASLSGSSTESCQATEVEEEWETPIVQEAPEHNPATFWVDDDRAAVL